MESSRSQTSHTSEDMKFESLPIHCINLLNSHKLQEIKVMEINVAGN